MKSVDIELSATERVKAFVNIANRYPYPVLLRQGRFVVNGKSILGIFSLDRTKPITMDAYTDQYADLMQDLRQVRIC